MLKRPGSVFRLCSVWWALLLCLVPLAHAESPPRTMFEAIATRPWMTAPAASDAASPRATCDYSGLVGQAFSEADLSIIETPFRISYTRAPPIAFLKPRVTVLVDLPSGRILRVLCPGPVSSAR